MEGIEPLFDLTIVLDPTLFAGRFSGSGSQVIISVDGVSGECKLDVIGGVDIPAAVIEGTWIIYDCDNDLEGGSGLIDFSGVPADTGTYSGIFNLPNGD